MALSHPGGGHETPGEGGSPAAGAFPAQNVGLLAWLPLEVFGEDVDSGADCWGYTSPDGREYALMGLNDRVAFVDVTDPSRPHVVDQIPHPSSPWCDIKTHGEFAYIVNETGGGMQVVDLRAIDQGVVVELDPVTVFGLDTAHNVIANPDSDFIYLSGVNAGGVGGLMAFDVSDPANPMYAGIANDWYVHDAQVVTMADGREIAFCFVGGGGVRILDVTDKTDMIELSRTEYATLGYCHQGWYDPATELLYVNDETDELDGNVPVTTTYVFDVSDLTAPALASVFTSGLATIDHNLYIRDGAVFQANYESGLRVFDLASDPLTPPQTGWFDTYPSGNGISFNGAWSVYTGLPSGQVIVSDINSGLFVLDTTRADGRRDPASAPGAFWARFPGPDERGVSSDVTTFDWSAAPGADFYRVEIATDEAMTNVIFEAERQAPRVVLGRNVLDDCRTYYWRIEAVNASGVTAGSLGAVRFSTEHRLDVTGDGLVGSADLGAMLADWGGSGPSDYSGDGVINSADLGILLAEWNGCEF